MRSCDMKRPFTTLFMLSSLDGKISTGASDALDMDRDLPQIDGVKEGLAQYYKIEQTTDLWSLNTGRVQAKMGVNEKPFPAKGPVSFVLVDSRHLTEHGVRYFCALSQKFVLITTNPHHPAFGVRADNLFVILQEKLSLKKALTDLWAQYGCERLTIQSGGRLNGLFLSEKLIDAVDVVIAPLLVGGKDTPTLIDGPSRLLPSDLSSLGVLRLESCEELGDSYLRLRYRVVHAEKAN